MAARLPTPPLGIRHYARVRYVPFDSPVVDVGDIETWPGDVLGWVRDLAELLRDTTEYISDLELYGNEQDELLTLLTGTKLRAYHGTRLLPHEVDRVWREGLRALDEELVESRIAAALAHGDLTAQQAGLLRRYTVFAKRRHEFRQGQVCAVLGRETLDHGASGLWRLLNTWGGEAIYAELGEGADRRGPLCHRDADGRRLPSDPSASCAST